MHIVLIAIVALAAPQAPCPEEVEAIERAARLVNEFNLSGAAGRLLAARRSGCGSAEAAAVFVRGLADARTAFLQGAPPESLAAVNEGIVALERIARDRPGPAEIARLLLHAAAAAAQSERDEMRLYLDQAVQMELVQRAAGQPGAPVISALVVAGDLWLQVHRYDEARRAYRTAAEHLGVTSRIAFGLARASARLGDTAATCEASRELIGWWGARTATPSEIDEARKYLAQPACAQPR